MSDLLGEVSLAEISNKISYGYTASATSKNTGVKFLRITDIVPERIDWESVPFCEISESDYQKYKINTGDILIARTGATTGYNKTITNLPYPAVYASYLIKYDLHTENVSPYFVKYILQSSLWYDYVSAVSGGSAQPGANAKVLGSFKFSLPPLPEQKAIASVLSALDDKIDLLQRQNQTLEQMAATLFRQWFIEEAKEDWEDGYIIQMISLQNGYAFKSKDFSEIGIYKIIKIKNIDNKIVDIVNTDFVSEDIAKQCADKFQIKNGAILIAMTGAEIGKLGIVPKNSDNLLLNQRVGMFLPKFNGAEFLAYLYFITDYGQEYIWNAATGSAQPNISGYQIEQAPFPIIPTSQLEQYGSRIKPYFDKLIDNLGQIQTLQSLRDTLLPKLISGEVRLKGFEAVS